MGRVVGTGGIGPDTAATTFLVFAGLALAGFRQAAKPQNLGEITAERINIVDANGNASMEFLDATGKVIQRVGPGR